VILIHKAVYVGFRSDSTVAVTVVKVYRKPTSYLDYSCLRIVPAQSVVVDCLLLWLVPGCELFGNFSMQVEIHSCLTGLFVLVVGWSAARLGEFVVLDRYDTAVVLTTQLCCELLVSRSVLSIAKG
jgi:hypothetical protein